MPVTKYSRFDPNGLDGLSLEDLLAQLSDYLLQSGFEDYYSFSELGDHTIEGLREAVMRALIESGALTPEQLEKLQKGARESVEELLDQVIRRLEEEGFIHVDTPLHNPTALGGADSGAGTQPYRARARFEVTDKAIDLLGYRTLRDLLAGLGRSSFGQHETRELSTGVENTGSSKPYEFGDTLSIDTPSTVLAAVKRNGIGVPVDIDYPDLHVHQCEYRSSCATVLMLDCSHSMILYGEDRFTPAKRVALALTQLIRTQYPGDRLHLVLFHDSAEEVPLSQLARVRVGPFYTNTAEGLRVARRILARERTDMREIVMITDGKPSALTLDDGRIYKNPMGLDPLVMDRTFAEVSACRRAGILINTFMLARDWLLVSFVKKVTEMVRGKAYFTTPSLLGQYVLLDYLNRRTKTIH
ncbi:MAG: VWA domain-containing protein [Acidobacteriota bacterium]